MKENDNSTFYYQFVDYSEEYEDAGFWLHIVTREQYITNNFGLGICGGKDGTFLDILAKHDITQEEENVFDNPYNLDEEAFLNIFTDSSYILIKTDTLGFD